MVKILASSSEKVKVNDYAAIGPASLNPFADDKLCLSSLSFNPIKVPLTSISVDELDEEKSKSFLGAAGLGLVGAALLGPLGLLAGALAGGNKKKNIFGISFNFEGTDFKLIVESTSKESTRKLKQCSYKKMVS